MRSANDNGTSNSNLSSGAIIVIVLVAAGFAVLIGFSTTRFFFNKNDHDPRETSDEQTQHMREVRRRNAKDMGLGIDTKRPYRFEQGGLPSPETERSSHMSSLN